MLPLSDRVGACPAGAPAASGETRSRPTCTHAQALRSAHTPPGERCTAPSSCGGHDPARGAAAARRGLDETIARRYLSKLERPPGGWPCCVGAHTAGRRRTPRARGTKRWAGAPRRGRRARCRTRCVAQRAGSPAALLRAGHRGRGVTRGAAAAARAGEGRRSPLGCSAVLAHAQAAEASGARRSAGAAARLGHDALLPPGGSG